MGRQAKLKKLRKTFKLDKGESFKDSLRDSMLLLGQKFALFNVEVTRENSDALINYISSIERPENMTEDEFEVFLEEKILNFIRNDLKNNQKSLKENQKEVVQDNQLTLPVDKGSDSKQEVVNKDEEKQLVKTDKPQEEVISETDKKVEAIPTDPEINFFLEKAKASGLNDTELANLIKSTKQTVVRWRKGQSKPSRHFKDIFQHWKVQNDLWFPQTDSPQFKFK